MASFFLFSVESGLPRRAGFSNFAVAIAAVHWPAFAGLGRYFSTFPDLSALRREHLTPAAFSIAAGAAAAAAKTFRFPRRATRRAPLGLIGVTALGEEFLLRCGERESLTAIGTRDCLVCVSH